jgi:hypothetical protein
LLTFIHGRKCGRQCWWSKPGDSYNVTGLAQSAARILAAAASQAQKLEHSAARQRLQYLPILADGQTWKTKIAAR